MRLPIYIEPPQFTEAIKSIYFRGEVSCSPYLEQPQFTEAITRFQGREVQLHIHPEYCISQSDAAATIFIIIIIIIFLLDVRFSMATI